MTAIPSCIFKQYPLAFLLGLFAIVGPASSQVIYTETFTGPDQSTGTTLNADHTWTVLGGVAALSGNALVEGLEAYAMYDAGTNLAYTPASDSLLIEFDFTPGSFFDGSGIGAGVFSIPDGGANFQIQILLDSPEPPFTLLVFDGTTTELATLGTPGSLVAGTTYHVSALVHSNTTTTCTVSITAVSGPGGDVLNGAMTSTPNGLGSATGPFNPLAGGAEDLITYTMDNLVITKSAASVPATAAAGLAVTALLVVSLGLRRFTRARA